MYKVDDPRPASEQPPGGPVAQWGQQGQDRANRGGQVLAYSEWVRQRVGSNVPLCVHFSSHDKITIVLKINCDVN